MNVLFAGVAVRDFAASRAWYEQLFGRPADVVAHATEVMWRVTDGGWLYIVEDPPRAGSSLVAITVADLDAAVSSLAALNPGSITLEGEGARKSTLHDPDGNVVALIQVPT